MVMYIIVQTLFMVVMPMLRGLRILVVEDSPIIAWAVRDVLLDAEAEVIGPADTLDQSLALVEAHEIDAALLDIWLRGIPSYPLGAKLLERNIPFVLMSGQSSCDEPDYFRTAPRLLKPFVARDLIDAFSAIHAARAMRGRPLSQAGVR